jgi:hypothetical protein
MTPSRQRMIEDMRIRNFTEQTQTSHCHYVSQFARHFRQSPDRIGPEEIRAYQHYLVHERKLSASSLFVAVGALRFLYRVTLKKDWPIEAIIPTPKRQTQAASRAEPGRSPPAARCGGDLQTSGDPDDVLRGRPPDLGSHSAHAAADRQRGLLGMPADRPSQTAGPTRGARDLSGSRRGANGRFAACHPGVPRRPDGRDRPRHRRAADADRHRHVMRSAARPSSTDWSRARVGVTGLVSSHRPNRDARRCMRLQVKSSIPSCRRPDPCNGPLIRDILLFQRP